MKTFSISRLLCLYTGIFFSVFLFSCNKNNDDSTPIDGAGLMTVNLAPETTASFTISGNTLGSFLPFNSYSGGYLSIFPGSRTVSAYTAGGLAANNTTNFESGKYYSLFLVDTGAALEQIIVQDNFDSLASTSQSFIRYVNAISEAAVSPSITVSVNGNNIVNESAPFKSVSDFVAVDAGSITITVTNGGNINASRTITVESQKVYTLLLSGIAGATGDNAVQIKFIANGTVDGTAGKAGSAGYSAVISN